MATGIPTAALKLGQLMDEPFHFVVPPYQRGYAWTTKEAGQLLEDLVAASGVDSEELAEPDYFLGSIVLMTPTVGQRHGIGVGPPRSHEIVDGQQRLVTLTIACCVLRDLESDAGSDVVGRINALVGAGATATFGPWRLSLRGRQQAFLEACVLRTGACGEMPEDEHTGRAEGRMLEIREEFLSVLSELDAGQRARLAGYLIDKCHFVVMQTDDIDRAHRMFLVLNGRGRPLGRNDILKAEVLSSISADVSEAVTAAWEAASEQLGPEHFEDFFGHVRTIYGQRRPQIIAGMRTIIAGAGGGEAFLETVFKPLSAAYRAILEADHQGAPQSAAIRQSLVYLNRLSGTEWVPAAMLAMTRLAGDPAKLAQTLSEIDRLAYLLRVLCLGRGKRVTRFGPVLEALRNDAPIDAACRFDRDERKSIAYHLRDLHVRSPQVCKLILMRLNDTIGGRFIAAEPGAWNVEHVLPKRPGDASEWRRWFADTREREIATESLGNLMLVPTAVNDRARNQPFARKQQIYLEAGDDAMLPLRGDVMACTEWRAGEIAERQARLFGLLDAMWGLGLDTTVRPAPDEMQSVSQARRRRA